MPGPAVVDLDYRRFDLCCLALSCQVSMTICQNCRRWSFDFACLLLMRTAAAGHSISFVCCS